MAMKVRYTVVNGEVLSENRGGVKRDYLPDTQGNTIGLIDNTQTITDTFTYYPYGEVASRTGTNVTPFQFLGTLGYYRDSASRTYVRARTLNTAQGRWMTQDPIGFKGGDINLYRYVNNRPTVLTDPSGLYGAPYGQYCGFQTDPGTGIGEDPLDVCCHTHDDCFFNAIPPCTAYNQWTRDDCRKCTAALCLCALDASCNKWRRQNKRRYLKCLVAREITRAYACTTALPALPILPPFPGAPN